MESARRRSARRTERAVSGVWGLGVGVEWCVDEVGGGAGRGWMRSPGTEGGGDGEPAGRQRRGSGSRRPPPGRVPRPSARVPRRRCPDSPAAAPPAEPGPACARAEAWPPPPPLERLEPVSVPFPSPAPSARAHRRRSCSNGVENGHWAAMSSRLSAPRFVLSCL